MSGSAKVKLAYLPHDNPRMSQMRSSDGWWTDLLTCFAKRGKDHISLLEFSDLLDAGRKRITQAHG